MTQKRSHNGKTDSETPRPAPSLGGGLQTLADALPVCLSYLDTEQRYRFTNKAFEETFGRTREELYGKHIAELLGTRAYDMLKKTIERALAGEQASFEGLLPFGRLGERRVSSSFVPDLENGTVVRGLFWILRDPAQQEPASRLLQAERLGAASDLAFSIAQEMNNPLTVLIGTLEMSLESPSRPKPKPDRILRLAYRIRSVVSEMLRRFREANFNPAVIDPALLVERVCNGLRARAEAQGVTLTTMIHSELPPLVLDADLVHTALLNIAENSLDAMPDGGALTLELADLPELGLVEFRISDEGPGISSSQLEEIFKPFFSTKEGGAGLGLSIAKGVIRGHEGRIRIEERAGGGTTVAVELPRPPERETDESS